jgi:hypothetical protein
LVRMFAIRLADHSERSALLRRARNLASIGTVHVGTAALGCPASEAGRVLEDFPYGEILLVETSEAGRVREGFPYLAILLVQTSQAGRVREGFPYPVILLVQTSEARQSSGRGFPYPVILLVQTSEARQSSDRLPVPCDFIGPNERSSAEFGKGTASAVP